MKHARKDYDRIQDPAGLIPADEPVFIIRGQDIIAGEIVRAYAAAAARVGASPELIGLCRRHAEEMERWPKKKVPDLPDQPAAPTPRGALDGNV